MKKLLYIIFFISIPSIAQFEVGNFKAENGKVVWQKVYDEDLPLESGNINLNGHLPNEFREKKIYSSLFMTKLKGADMGVEKREGKTRITLTNIYAEFEVSYINGNKFEGGRTTAFDEYVNKKTGVFKKKFLKKYERILNEIIEREINDLLPKDDW